MSYPPKCLQDSTLPGSILKLQGRQKFKHFMPLILMDIIVYFGCIDFQHLATLGLQQSESNLGVHIRYQISPQII